MEFTREDEEMIIVIDLRKMKDFVGGVIFMGAIFCLSWFSMAVLDDKVTRVMGF